MTTVKNRHLDRLLQRRGDRWHYVRRVPASLADHDSRQPLNRNSSKTADRAWRESCATRSSRPTTIGGPRSGGRRYRCGRETLRWAFAIGRRRSWNQSQPAGTPAKGGSARFVRCAATISPSCDPDRRKPFSGPGFEAERRASVPSAWPKNRIAKASALDGLNDEARAILMAIIETGARARAICNLAQDHIFVDAEIPFIRIIERDDPDSPRELRTRSRSRR